MKKLNKAFCVLFLFLLVCSSCLPFAAAEDLDTPVNEDIPVDLQYIRHLGASAIMLLCTNGIG